MKESLHKKALSFPKAPGVYFFKNKNGVIIYIGKAAVLKNRVSQYFQSRANHSLKTMHLVKNAADLEYIVTASEIEALILESSLIKRYKPRYNILLKDDKGYPFIRLDTKAPYPVFEVVNKRARDGAEYFGPYGGRNVAFGVISSISEALKLPLCSRKFPRDIGKERPCLHYRTGRCFGPCISAELGDTYRALIDEAVMMLKGNYEGLKQRIAEEMEAATEALDFERAAILRDRLRGVSRLGERQKVITSDRGCIDAVGCSFDSGKLSIALLSVAGGQIISQLLRVFPADSYAEAPEMLSEFLKLYYIDREELPDKILVSHEFEDLSLLRDFFLQKRNKAVSIEKPARGVNLDLLKMAEENARKELERVVGNEDKSSWQESELCRLLGLKPPLSRIEAFDISNTGGSDIVASLVVFKNMKPCKSEYRTYSVKTLENQDDYGAMREVLERRGRRMEGADLILLDGGAGHVAVGREVLYKFSLDIPLYGMVKDARHKTRALVDSQGFEVSLESSPAAFAAVAAIQEEAHRFAINFHRKKRSKSVTKSVLDGINGVGKFRKAALIRHFKGVNGVKTASIDQLRAVVPRNVAQNIFDYFHKNDGGTDGEGDNGERKGREA